MTEGFQALGYTVFGCARTISADDSNRFFACDISNDSQVQSFAERVLSEGPPDILINNAAIINQNAPLWKIGEEDFSRIVAVNLCGTVNMIRHFVPAMISASSGIIVNFSSYWGRSTSPDVASYCATKWGIEGLTSSLAQDLPSGLAAVALNPGVINTEMLQSCFGSSAGSYPSPQHWAESAVPFINGFTEKDNGQSLTVPGH